MAPPAKRRKRNNVVVISSSSSSSEDKNEDEILSSSPLANHSTSLGGNGSTGSVRVAKTVPPKPKSPAAKASTHPLKSTLKYPPKQKTAKKAISASPEKSNSKSKKVAAEKNADIQALFSKQAQLQRELGNRPLRRTLSRTSSLAEDDNDPISDDDEIKAPKPQLSLVAATAKKRKQGLLPSAAESELPSATQKFRKPAPKDTHNEDDMRPWAERFGPVNLEELAVHKRKVADVRRWLETVMEGRMRQRLLILKGAAGTGKTTTVQLLAKDLNCEVLEWRNADGSIASSDGFLSMSAQFEEFMGRGGKFGQLDVISSASNASMEPISKSERRKQIILIEEFPSTFTRSSTALQSFRATVLQYLAANTPSLSVMYGSQRPPQPITPVIMIISETLLTTTSASADSFTAHRLLGPEILQHPGINIIEFNAIAPTILAKALDLVVQKESRKSGRRKTPGPAVLKRLGEVGDIRSAIGSLEFLCIRGDSIEWSGKVSFAKTKKSSKTEPAMTKMEEESLELVTQREASLGIFHAVGKVMYNKRDDLETASPTAALERLPNYMSHCSRPRKSLIKVDELIDETGTDTQTFIAALHENYILSCDAPPTSIDFSSIDHVNDCIDALSDSDLLGPSWDGSFNSTGFGGSTGIQGSGGDILRQDELSFQIAVRGILFSLPYPVKRRAPEASGFRTGKTGDAFKMFYPTSLKLWRMKEEIESTIDMWVTRLKKGEPQLSHSITAGAKAFAAKPKPGSVESWGSSSSRNFSLSTLKDGRKESNDREKDDSVPLLATGTSARKEMLLERLPYMVQIARPRKNNTSTFSSLTLREMEKVTTFTGIGGPNDEVSDGNTPDDDTNRIVEEWATDKAGDEDSFLGNRSGKRGSNAFGKNGGGRSNKIKGDGAGPGGGVEQEVQRLVLSDDDIEDY